MRLEVQEFVKLGPLPDETADVDRIEKFSRLFDRISKPISDEEVRALIKSFGPDECFGLAWSLIHLLETAPGWPLEDCLGEPANEWIQLLRERVENARKLGKM